MTEQQDHTRRFAEEPTVTREQFVEASELAGIRYLDHEEAVRVCAFAVQQEQAREAAEYSADEHYRHMMMWQEEAQSEKARAESLELSLRTACAERDAVLAESVEWEAEADSRLDRLAKAEAVVARVREEHCKVADEDYQKFPYCEGCGDGWPCGTIRILDAAAPDLDAGSKVADQAGCSDPQCERKANHPGLHLMRCRRTQGCAEAANHRGKCTSGLWGAGAQIWAETAAAPEGEKE